MDNKEFEKVLEAKIPENLRHFILVACNIIIDDELEKENIKALIKAVELINGKLHFDKIYRVIVGRSPFKISSQNNSSTYELKNGVINSVSGDIILLSFDNMRKLPFSIKTACIVEEFVHAVMNVTDENLTTKIVKLIYPDVHVTPDGRFDVATARNQISGL